MFCDKCGKNNAEGTAFCEECGNPLTVSEEAAVAAPKDKNKMIAAIVAIVVAIVAIFGIGSCAGCFSGPETPVKNMFKAIEKGDANAMLKAYPKAFVKTVDKDQKEDLKEELKEAAKEMKEEKIKISYKVKDKKKIDKDDLKDVEKAEETMLKFMDAKDTDVKVTAGYELEVEVTVKEDGDKETNEVEMNVYKIDGRWCFAVSDMPSMMGFGF